MKCYNHHDRDAFGVCKSCGKALCLECLEETEGIIHCKGNPNCKELASLNVLSYAVMKKAYAKERVNGLNIAGILSAIVGIFLIILGLFSQSPDKMYLLMIGAIAVTVGCANYLTTRKLPTVKNTKTKRTK